MASETAHVASGGGSPPTERAEARDHTNDAAVDNNSNVPNDNSSDDDHIRDEKAAPGPTKWQKVKAHFWRFKWWYLLAGAVLLAILLPLMFTVIIPAIIQDVLNDQKLPIRGGRLQALSPDRLNMSVDTQLKVPIGIHLNPLNLSMYTENATSDQSSSFLMLRFPGMHVEGTTNVNLTEQTLPVTNQTELLIWFNEFFDKPKVKLTLRGKPRVHLSTLKYTKDLDNTIEVPSLNYLDGFAVKSQSFNMNNDTKYNMKGVLNIPNSGVLTLGLGNQTWNILSGDVNLGLINLYNLTLYPGNNSVPFEGNFFFDELVPNLKTILDDQKGPLGKGYVEFYTSGNTTVVDGVHIPYIEGVLNRKRVRFTIPVITLLGDVLGGILDDKDGSLLDVFGEAIGNRTLFENVLDHWNALDKESNKDEKRDLLKRAKSGRPWMLNLLRLGTRLNKA